MNPKPRKTSRARSEIDTAFLRAEELWPEYELRPQQIAMAKAVMASLEQGRSLIVEAPTGVGKTLAYLIPSILVARQHERKALISTHTKNLQDQLYLKDIPRVRSLLDIPFSCVVLKGRRNYLCPSRLRAAILSAQSLFVSTEQKELELIQAWAKRTTDGDLESLGFNPSPQVRNMVCSEPGVCTPRTCREECFFKRSREMARQSEVVILNHALFFQLLSRNTEEEGLLYEDDFVVFDEAHTLESVASSSLGMHVSRHHLVALISRLYNPHSKKGLCARAKKPLKSMCSTAVKTIDEFFDVLEQAARSARPGKAREVRILTPSIVIDTVTPLLTQLTEAVADFADAGKLPSGQELLATVKELETVSDEIHAFLTQSMEGNAYWLESRMIKGGDCALCAAPENVGSVLGARLFSGRTPVIMTSATIAVNGNAEFFQGRLGAEQIDFLPLDSPFQLARQMRITIARDMPEPDSDAFARELPVRILQAIDRTHGKALVLFTNTALMRAVAETLRDPLDERRIALLVQHSSASRHHLLESFKEDIDSVLFGLDSFWTGVDVPGEALCHVVITKLPFVVPSHPLMEARQEAIVRSGRSPFMAYFLPEAVLKLRQGVGRLIRNTADTGLITILDSRIFRKPYGRIFLSGLPSCPVEFIDKHGNIWEAEFSSYLP